MRSSPMKVINLSLFIVVVLLAMLLLFPFRNGSVDTPETDANEIEVMEEDFYARNTIPESVGASPEKVAELFGYKKDGEIGHTDNEVAETAQVIGWIEPVGFYVGTDGRHCWFLKNNRTNEILLLSEGEAEKGWRLVRVTEEEFLLEYEGTFYTVRKRFPER